MVSRLMVALVLVAAAVVGGAAAVHGSSSGVPVPVGTPGPTRHGLA